MILTKRIKWLIRSILRPQINLKSGINPLYRVLVFFYQLKCNFWYKLHGLNNFVAIGDGTIIRDCRVQLVGNNNTLIIGQNCRLILTTIDIISNNSLVVIGNSVSILGNHMGYTHLLAKGDTTNISIGDDCLISYGIEIRTTDSHSIFDHMSSELLNPPKSINIGNHVWIGARSMILKGASIGEGSVIGANSIVNRAVGENVIAAGQPCKELKSSIRWSHDIPQIVEPVAAANP